tara:strand:+ start:2159 stop:2398 length:240 start_codon:yes stop_codon:yes gene_type:complete
MQTNTLATPTPQKTLIRLGTLASMLDLSRSGFDKLRLRDPSFPVPIKDGETRQAAVFFVAAEVESWLKAKMAQREQGAI